MDCTKRMRKDKTRGGSRKDIRREWTRTKNTKKNRRRKKESDRGRVEK